MTRYCIQKSYDDNGFSESVECRSTCPFWEFPKEGKKERKAYCLKYSSFIRGSEAK